MAWTKRDLERALGDAGIEEGGIVLVHSDIGRFGFPEGPSNKKDISNTFIEAFVEVLGSHGTLVVPTFTYSFCYNEVYDHQNSPSTMGMLSEAVRTCGSSVRSLQPLFSVAALGGKAVELTENIGHSSFGHDCIFDRLLKVDAKFVFLGISFDYCTFIHYVEQSFGVPYRYLKYFSGEIIDNGRRYVDTFDYNVRPLDWDFKPYLIPFQEVLERKGLMNKVQFGKGSIRLVNASVVYNEAFEKLNNDIYFLLDKAPSPPGG